ncbi:MAG TPA: acetyl-CoA acetyltransferase [Acidimicrobiales bacterium]|nr:acetyl-CoA acetyltransferase [Acidimicrobiales bacterium]
MTLDPRTPVLVGVGQVTERPVAGQPVTDRAEPVDLMARALRAAATDCQGAGAGDRLLARAGSMRIIVPLSWGYSNPGLLVSERLGLTPKEQVLTAIGGNNPQTVASATALAIAAGDLDVALVAGADCIYTRLAARRDPDRPILPWTVQPPATKEPVRLGVDRVATTDTESARGLDRPNRIYPLFENALRAAAGESIAEHQQKLSRMWARFSEVAATNPYAWFRQPRTALEIRTVGPDNRMVSFPYPKLCNANDRVDQGAAMILCSVDAARSAGVPEDRWVFPLSGADASDHWFLSHRQDLHSSPAIRLAARHALHGAGVGIDDIAHVDLYSCFPCAVQIAANEFGLLIDDTDRPLTVTGGLGFAGGPGNNYVSHSIATMADRLRGDPGSLGLVTGLGWYVTKHAVGLWSTTPPAHGFAYQNPQDEVDALPQRPPASDYEGDATVETYTVIHQPDGQPDHAIAALLTDDGARAWGTTSDPDTLLDLETEEGCGRRARLFADGRVELR